MQQSSREVVDEGIRTERRKGCGKAISREGRRDEELSEGPWVNEAELAPVAQGENDVGVCDKRGQRILDEKELSAHREVHDEECAVIKA